MNNILHFITIPKTAKKIIFNDRFNSHIEPEFIPDGVTNIIFGDDFNQLLEVGVIPKSVSTIIFGSSYNKKLEVGVIPEGVPVFKNDRAQAPSFLKAGSRSGGPEPSHF